MVTTGKPTMGKSAAGQARQDAAASRRIRGLDAEQRQAERRRLLLAAALELFGTAGYAATSVEQICQSAYVSTRSFYELFPHKEACYLALHRELEATVTRQLTAAADRSADAGMIPSMVAAFVHAMTDDIRVLRVTSIEAMCISPAVEQRRNEARHRGAALVEAAWARLGITPRRASPRRLALGVVGAFFDILIDWYTGAGTDDTASLIRDLTGLLDLLNTGLGASP